MKKATLASHSFRIIATETGFVKNFLEKDKRNFKRVEFDLFRAKEGIHFTVWYCIFLFL